MDNRIEFLEDYEIDYRSSGPNVTQGWVNINCPFCHDPSYHLGLSPNGGFNCWVCSERGSIQKLIQNLLSISFGEAKAIYLRYFDTNTPSTSLKTQIIGDFKLGKDIENRIPEIGMDFLFKRGYSPNEVIPKYSLMWGNRLSDYSFRIIIPVISGGKIVGFVGRSINDRKKPKYKNAKWFDRTHYVYGLDDIRDKCIIVEGIFDKWRVGDRTIATLGIEWTHEQARLIIDKGVKRAIIVYDGEKKAQEQAMRLGNILSGFMEIEIIEPDTDIDPDTMPEDQLEEIRNLL